MSDATATGDIRYLYDAAFGEGAAGLTVQAEADLRALARVYDLDAERPPREVWAALRPVLAAQDHSGHGTAPPLRVMVVEDDPDMAALLVDCLTDAGHSVIGPLHDAESARISASQHAVDIALLDINLSGPGSGVELARTLKGSWGVPVMFLSGDVTQAANNVDLAAGLLIKPYRGRDVLAALGAAWRKGAIAA